MPVISNIRARYRKRRDALDAEYKRLRQELHRECEDEVKRVKAERKANEKERTRQYMANYYRERKMEIKKIKELRATAAQDKEL